MKRTLTREQTTLSDDETVVFSSSNNSRFLYYSFDSSSSRFDASSNSNSNSGRDVTTMDTHHRDETIDVIERDDDDEEEEEEETASLLAWISAKNEALLEEEEEEEENENDEEATPRRGPPPLPSSGAMASRAKRIDEAHFENAPLRGDVLFSEVEKTRAETTTARLDGMRIEQREEEEEEEERYMRRNPRSATAWYDEKPMILPEAKPIGSYPMSDLERRTLEMSAEPKALERAIHRAMERAGMHADAHAATPILETAATTVSENVQEEKCARAQNRDFKSSENVSEIRESATRVKVWFRSVGVELNESALVSARITDDNEIDTFARALTKAAMDGSLLKEIVESESNAQIPSSVFAASSSITEGVLKHLRNVPGVKPRFLWCEDEIETGVNVEATVGLFDDIRACGRWH